MLLSEGNTDVTITTHAVTQGALRVFVRRILARELKRSIADREIVGGRLPRLQRGGGYSRKVKRAIELYSKNADISHLGIAIDRDGEANKKRLGLLRSGRDESAKEGHRLALSTALGVAIEMLESWLLADTAALAQVLGVSGSEQNPESIRNPKATLNKHKGDNPLSVNEIYDKLAEQADLDVVMKRCPSFAQFVNEVRQKFVN